MDKIVNSEQSRFNDKHIATNVRNEKGKTSIFGNDGLKFSDFLDVINPLHHIPVLGSLYRAITSDEISPASRMAGGAVFAGPIGAVIAVAGMTIDKAVGFVKKNAQESEFKIGSGNFDAVSKDSPNWQIGNNNSDLSKFSSRLEESLIKDKISEKQEWPYSRMAMNNLSIRRISEIVENNYGQVVLQTQAEVVRNLNENNRVDKKL